jgi:short-subunit dehydrogenase
MTSSSGARRLAVVTGASSGIGLDLAWICAEHGYDLLLVARSRDVLERLAQEISDKHGGTATVCVADLADASAPRQIYDAAKALRMTVEILINNAGFGDGGRFDQMSLDEMLAMVQVNATAVTALTRLFLPDMLPHKRGRIMNVASTAAFQPGPLMAVYYATKAYVLSLTEAIADELRDTGVTLTALCPGPTRTQFAEIAKMRNSRLFTSPLLLDARPVAEYGFHAMLHGKRVAIPGWINRLGVFATRLAPRRVAAMIPRRLHEMRS